MAHLFVKVIEIRLSFENQMWHEHNTEIKQLNTNFGTNFWNLLDAQKVFGCLLRQV